MLKTGYGAVRASGMMLDECQLFPEALGGCTLGLILPEFTMVQNSIIVLKQNQTPFRITHGNDPGAVGWVGAHFGFQGEGSALVHATASLNGGLLVFQVDPPQ